MARPEKPEPLVPPPEPTHLSSVLARNIQALQDRRKREEAESGWQTRLAERVTGFTGSMTFVWVHLAVVGAWVAINLGVVPGAPRFDPTFVILATCASVEAIFLSTFVLISQNRQSALAEQRSELDLQITLLAEHEITRALRLTVAIAEKLGIEPEGQEEIVELQRDVAPEAVLDEIEDETPAR